MSNVPHPALVETSARIRHAMSELGLSHKQVAEAMGMEPGQEPNVYNWATGRNAPNYRRREALARVLGLEASDIAPEGWKAGGSGGRLPLAPDEKARRKRERDREYKRQRSAEQRAQRAGPAERAVALYAEAGPEPAPRPVARPDDVFTTAIRSDGTMQVRLNLTLPVAEGIALVQMLYAADALRGLRG